jgi:hypothetical protein
LVLEGFETLEPRVTAPKAARATWCDRQTHPHPLSVTLEGYVYYKVVCFAPFSGVEALET